MREKLLHKQAAYLRDAVFAASDGLVTTFAVVAGSTGAAFDPSVVVILGFANLFADGFSMSAGTYLGIKSEMEFEKAEGDRHINEPSPFKQGLITFFSFDIAGLLPLLPYLFKMKNAFEISILIVFITLFIVGVSRGKFTRKGWFRSGAEILLIGGFAAFVAYGTGYLIKQFGV